MLEELIKKENKYSIMLQNNPQWTEEQEFIVQILNKLPLEKAVKWGADVYTYNGKNVVSYGGFKNYFAIWFYNGVFLSDPKNVLVNAQEGKTKSLRQWRFTSIGEMDENLIKQYVLEAIEVEKKGLKLAPEKTTELPVSEFLNETFATDENLKIAFEQLTPGRQKEYIEYINEAKQEKTKQSRLEKITPMILQKIGLNDKYKK